MLPNSLPHWCIIGIRSSTNKQVSSPSNTNARTLQHMQSSSPMDPSTLRNPWQRASRSAGQMRSTWRATINQHIWPGKDHHHQNSAETQNGEGCIPPYWQARPGGFGTTAFWPQQAQRTHAQETKSRSFPQRVPVVRRTRPQGIRQKVITTYVKPAPPTGIYKYLNGSNKQVLNIAKLFMNLINSVYFNTKFITDLELLFIL